MLEYPVIGHQDDWANFVTSFEMIGTPFMDWLPIDSTAMKGNDYSYLVEKYRDPRKNRHIDGHDFDTFTDPTEGNARLRATLQWFDEGVGIKRLAQDNSNVEAIDDLLAHGTLKKLKEMRRDAEVQLLSQDDCFEDNQVEGYATRGVGSWLNPAAQTLYPVPADYRPALQVDANSIVTAGQVVTVTTANMATYAFDLASNVGFEAMVTFVLSQMWNKTKQGDQIIDCFCGDAFKMKINQAQFYIPGTATGQNAVHWPGRDKTLSRAIDVLKTDYGTVRLNMTPLIGATAGVVPTISRYQARFLHREMWAMRWKQKPTVYKLPFQGGSYRRAMEMILMMYCKNPGAEGAYMPAA